jgi:endonuclease/exonuclease/phosphatase family metal-dependent hydrolase
MSFNVRVAIFIDAFNHWDFRKNLVVETIRSFNPDLLGTQEATASQTDYLRANLPDYDFTGAGRNDGARRGEMCGVFFRRARFDKLGEGHFWLSETPAAPGSKSWGTTYPRMVTWVKLRDRAGGNVICLFNTHFDHRGRRAREESAKLLREKITQVAGTLPVIITGDFNTDENTPPYRMLISGTRRGDERFVDTFRAYDRSPDGGEGTRHDFRGGRGGARIDWIVTDSSFQTVHAAIDHTRAGLRYPSDHFPVTAIVRPIAPLPVARVE